MKEVFEGAYNYMQVEFPVGAYSITLWQLFIFCFLCTILVGFLIDFFHHE